MRNSFTAASAACALALALAACGGKDEADTKPPAPEAQIPAGAADAIPVYKDPSATVEARVEDLLGRMTQEEKLAQITAVWTQKTALFDDAGNVDPEKLKALYPHGVGHFSRPNDLSGPSSPLEKPFRDERQTVELVNAIQRYSVTQTRLGIPTLFHEEGLHGYAARGATSFPQAIALASSFDPSLLTRVFSVAGREIRARGASMVLSPVIDVARDPRWGRIEETFGEDPYLAGEMGVAAIEGFQGPDLPLADGKVFATLKHMTGHGQPESGTNVGPANISERVLREVFFPPFEQAVKRTKVMNVMASYNEIDGVPSHANAWLLEDVLRGEWGFSGNVVSDYWGVADLVRLHRVEPDMAAAAARALNAGVDFDLPDGDAYKELPASLDKGLVTQERIDEAVRRMLRMKFLAGLFENPYADADLAVEITANDEARALALEAARKSIVLLKNTGVLPLSATKLRKIAVIGPNAAVTRLGGYSDVPRRTVSLLDGVTAAVGDKATIVHHEGVKISDASWWTDEVTLADKEQNLRMIEEAKAVARDADVIILAIGDTEATSREGWAANHLGDRPSLELVGEQQALADAMDELGKPLVVVLINGRPLGVERVANAADGLIEAWYQGQEGGTAMAEVIFGAVNPGGKLPVTIPRHVGQLPLVYNHKPSALRGYLFDTTEPLFPFGYGLSYTQFEIGAPRLSATSIGVGGMVTVSVGVANRGKRAGDEVVQLYIRDVVSSVTRPVKELRGFKRVTLGAGQTTNVEFVLDREDFQFWNKAMERVVETGDFEIMVGPNSRDVKTTKLSIVGAL